ncbi:hypothetical protein DV736_g6519, partial [Chaetothyriales sp. CBS 134916]
MAHNGVVPDLPDAATRPPEGIVLPPRDIRAIIEKTAGYVARNGAVFEDRIRDKEQGNPKFSFLAPGDAYAAFYQWRLSEVRSGRGTAVSAGRTGDNTPLAEKPKGPGRPADFVFSARMPNISAQDLEVVKLTALHVARKGKGWMTALSQREGRNYQFDFLRSAHSLHPFFQRLVDQYTLLLQTGPEAQKAEQARIQALQANLHDRFPYAQIDWHDFVVVETVLFTDADDHAELPPPTTLNDLQSASLEQKAMMSLARPDMRIEEAMPTDDMAGYAYTDPYHVPHTSGYMAEAPQPAVARPPPSYSPAPAPSSTPPATSASPTPQPVAGKPPMRIRQDYVPRAQQRAQRAQTALCPNCGQQIALAELDNHLRIELLDPEWKKQQAKATARSATTNLGGTDVAANLKRLRARTDATPLSLALFVSFVLLLLSTLSTPVIKSIPLATFEGVNFGVFGYCSSGNGCTPARVGYTTNGAFSSDNGDFQLSANTRHSLSSLLIVHPWGSWIVLASVICIAVSGVFTCAMRRTLVSRKARKKRIAENAEMSGENFYARQAAEDKMPPMALSAASDTTGAPIVNGAPGSDALPSFATYDSGRRMDDDRQPLNPSREANLTPVASHGNGSDPSRPSSQSVEGHSPPHDQYGNALAPHAVSDDMPPLPTGVRNRERWQFRDGDVAGAFPQPSVMPPPRRGYPRPPRGRAGYPPRGAYLPPRAYGPGPRGPPPQGSGYGYGRGGYPGPGRGGRGGFIAPGVATGAAAGGGVGGSMAAGGMRHEQQPPPPGYGPQNDQSLPEELENRDRGPEYGPYGHRTQSPARQQGSRGPSPARGARAESPPPLMPTLPRQPSNGSGPPDDYVPVRAGWNQAPPGPQSPLPPHTDQIGVAYGEVGRRPRLNSGGSDIYYEDVDPRFAPSNPMPVELAASSETIPRILTPSGRNYDDVNAPLPQQSNPAINSSCSYEDLPGARSPAGSEASNFTSVSQRGVNPNWRPGYA